MKKTVCIFKGRVEQLPFWDPDSICKGISGSEEGIIYSAQALKELSFKVFVLNNSHNKEKYSNQSANPCYAGYLHKDNFFDYTILHNDLQFIDILRPRTGKLFFFPNNPCYEKFPENQLDYLDGVLWVSAHQRNQWVSINPQLERFKEVFGYAVHPDPFKPTQNKTNPYSCIYASDYSRGLSILLAIWPKIKQKFPKATLDIYYGLRNWGNMSLEEERFIREKIQELKILGVTDHGQVGHEELANAFLKTSLWTYPCTCLETFCITAIKAQLGGCIPVVIEKGALSETVKFGFKCLRIEEYERLLTQVMEKIETVLPEERKQMGHFVLEHFTWDKMTLRWANLFYS